MLTTHRVTREYVDGKRRDKSIGDAITRRLNELTASSQGRRPTIVAVVPYMLSYFGQCPERYEVTEVDVIVESLEPVGTEPDARD